MRRDAVNGTSRKRTPVASKTALAMAAALGRMGLCRSGASDPRVPRDGGRYPCGLARAEAAGAKILMGLTDTDYGSRDFICRDPEGYVWCFGTYWPKAHEPAK
jgi:hypothetical protein